MSYGKTLNADVGNAFEDVATLNVAGASKLSLEVVVAAAALTGFNIDYQMVPGGAWRSAASAAGDYTGPVAPVLAASGSLTTAAVGTHWVRLDVSYMFAVRVQAKSGTSASVTLSYHAK